MPGCVFSHHGHLAQLLEAAGAGLEAGCCEGTVLTAVPLPGAHWELAEELLPFSATHSSPRAGLWASSHLSWGAAALGFSLETGPRAFPTPPEVAGRQNPSVFPLLLVQGRV